MTIHINLNINRVTGGWFIRRDVERGSKSTALMWEYQKMMARSKKLSVVNDFTQRPPTTCQRLFSLLKCWRYYKLQIDHWKCKTTANVPTSLNIASLLTTIKLLVYLPLVTSLTSKQRCSMYESAEAPIPYTETLQFSVTLPMWMWISYQLCFQAALPMIGR
jgi:hypothetical protein